MYPPILAYQPYDEGVLLYWLMAAVALLAIAACYFFAATFLMRALKIRKGRRSERYQSQCNAILFPYLFGEIQVEEACRRYKVQAQKRLFHKIALKSIISLHRSYSGQYSQLLENFYVQSGLVDFSLQKLKSAKWTYKVDAIRDLSYLNYQPATASIFSLLKHKKEIIRKEAFIAILLLKGVEALIELKDLNIYLDDWTQSKILHLLKIKQEKSIGDITEVFQSKNESIILLATRLVELFQVYALHPLVQESTQNIQSQKIKLDIDCISERIKIASA